MPKPARVLFLAAAMGAGHLQVAGELARRLEAGGATTEVADLLELMPAPAGRLLGAVYPFLVERPALYELVYEHFFLAEQRQAERASIPVRSSLRGLRRLLGRFEPDAVVSTYHLAGVAAAHLRSKGALCCPAVTMITTFGVHELWLHPATDRYLCISPQAAAAVAARTGVPVDVCEPVVRPEFRPAGPPTPAMRHALAPGAERVALVVAGSLGLGPVAETAAAVGSLPGWRAAVVCGHNKGLRAEIATIEGAVALGWVADMAGTVAAADVVVDNAAGSTAKEALAVGRPVLTYRPLAGHGRHDASMMQEAGLTEVIESPEQLRGALRRLSVPERAVERAQRGWALFGVDPASIVEKLLESGRSERCP